jgi:predicted aminopeptidase
MIPEGHEALGDLINVVLHESVHATLYINGQAYFNESVASFVADQLTLKYLDQIRGAQSPEKKAYLDSEEYRRKVQQKLHQAYQELAEVYASNSSTQDKLQSKEKILSRVKDELHFKREINNATLIQYKTYNTGQECFDQLLAQVHSNWKDFLKQLLTLKTESFSEPQQSDFCPVVRKLLNPPQVL